MRIRSITVFTSARPNLDRVSTLLRNARSRLESLGYTVQTTRLALPPAAQWAAKLSAQAFIKSSIELENSARNAGIDYLSLGPLVITPDRKSNTLLDALPELFSQTQSTFASALIAEEHRVHSASLPAIARAIKSIAKLDGNGFHNLRFAALACCAPGIPFFPAAYARADDFSFALAIEGADMALTAAKKTGSITQAQTRLRKIIEKHARRIEPVMDAASKSSGAKFTGCDWSLAPHPQPACSVGAALEKLSGAKLGEWGTLSAVAALTRAIRQAKVRHVGFCGVFLPVLEDAVLARRAAESSFDLQRLLLYSSVCGTGLDTIPLPADTSLESITALLSDVASMAAVHQKPLTVRLMPVPKLKSGQPTRFTFPYLVNSKTMLLKGAAPGLARDRWLSLM